METLKAMSEHWAIFLPKDVGANLDYEVRPDADDVGVVASVVDLAKRQAVRNDRFSTL